MTSDNYLDPGKNRTCDLRFRNPPDENEVAETTPETNRNRPESTVSAHNKPTANWADGWMQFAARAVTANRIDHEDGCSHWLSFLTKEGYPQVSICGKRYPAHRLVAALWYGPEAIRGKDLHHICGRKDCTRPDHLSPVTASEHGRIHKGEAHPPLPPRFTNGQHFTSDDVITVTLRTRAVQLALKPARTSAPWVAEVTRTMVLVALVLRWVERFEARVARSTHGCHQWIGGTQTRGYGWLGPAHGRNSGLAHRFAWELELGPIPDGLTVDHLCANKRCVRVDHLELVTRAENTRRARAIEAANRRLASVVSP